MSDTLTIKTSGVAVLGEEKVNEEIQKIEAVLVNGYAKNLYKKSKFGGFDNVLPCSESSFRYYASKENSIVR